MGAGPKGHARIDFDDLVTRVGVVRTPCGFDHQVPADSFRPEKRFPGFRPVLFIDVPVRHPAFDPGGTAKTGKSVFQFPATIRKRITRREKPDDSMILRTKYRSLSPPLIRLLIGVLHHHALHLLSIKQIRYHLHGQLFCFAFKNNFGFDPLHNRVHPSFGGLKYPYFNPGNTRLTRPSTSSIPMGFLWGTALSMTARYRSGSKFKFRHWIMSTGCVSKKAKSAFNSSGVSVNPGRFK